MFRADACKPGKDEAFSANRFGDTMGYSEGLWTPEATTLNQAKYNTDVFDKAFPNPHGG